VPERADGPSLSLNFNQSINQTELSTVYTDARKDKSRALNNVIAARHL
jgi:hypothetical protein